jgi:hypothetical protein
MKALRREGVDGLFRDLDALEARTVSLNETIARVVTMTPPEQEVAEALFAAFELSVMQISLQQDYSAAASPAVMTIIFSYVTFRQPTCAPSTS